MNSGKTVVTIEFLLSVVVLALAMAQVWLSQTCRKEKVGKG